ncbi:MAG TPA: Hsp20/alpha crystallin family protein [Chthoniobacterales bacterium]|nr:Hsp20/alpha crystallin family protein [Chthoniobacterales bacterium]
MAITDLIPWNRNRALATGRQDVVDPLNMLRHDIDRVFGDFLTDSRWPDRTMNMLDRQMGSFMPEIDVKETDKEFRVTADLPGMDEKDLEVTFVDGALSIKGEKREEHEEEKGDVYHAERRYGAFERMIPLSSDIDLNKAKATFKKGVLKVTLPKTENARSNRKTIPVEG